MTCKLLVRRRWIRLGLLLHSPLFRSLVVTDGTASQGSEDRVVAGKMTRHTAYGGSLDAPGRVRSPGRGH